MHLVNMVDSRKILRDVLVGENVTLWNFINLYECEIGDETSIGTFVEIQAGSKVGKRCRIQSHTFICTGVTIEDDVFIGHGVVFINDKYPRSGAKHKQQWIPEPITVGAGSSVGSGAVILGGVSIGRGVMIGAGSVVTHSVPDGLTVAGVPSRPTSDEN